MVHYHFVVVSNSVSGCVDVYATVHSALTVDHVESFKETLCLVGEVVSGRSDWCCSVRPDESYILYCHVVMIDV